MRSESHGGESAALSAITLMRQGQAIDFTERIALLAADLSLQTNLPMADSVILATARVHRTHIWTQDANFDGLDGVTFVAKQKVATSQHTTCSDR